MEKNYTLRKLNADDIFVMLKIINKIGIKDVKALFASAEFQKQINEALKDGASEEDANKAITGIGMQVAFDLACLISTHLPDCRDDIYAWLASLSGMKPKEIANLEMTVFLDMIMDVFQKEEFKDFFQHVLGLLK